MTVEATHFQLWDLNDETWGRSIELTDPEFEININAFHLLGGTRFATEPLGDDQPRLVVYDLALADPRVPTFVASPDGEDVARAALWGQDQIVVQIGGPAVADNILQVWSLITGDVLYQLDGARNFATTPGGPIYFTNSERQLWRWEPPAAAVQVAPDIQLPQDPVLMRVTTSGRVLMARSNLASVWDPQTKSTVALTGLEPDDDPVRFRTISIDELPDGRIVAAYPDGRISYWDVDNPGAPVIENIGQDLQQMAVLPDGRLLVSSSPANDMDPSEIEVITPPAS